MNAFRIKGRMWLGIPVDYLDIESGNITLARARAEVLKINIIDIHAVRLSKDTVKCIDGGRVKK